ncbi:hypothetical protein NQ317_004851 [Molorchus minor]|uniref:PCNA-associated factor histone-like domain-containing protein n=1 Tax=Molorchus minor TaxID=1323400 RepID=A0ABQ9J8G2_9CUCU|nr:hypothetical protein NQ317_004851 [Molorchus minor]
MGSTFEHLYLHKLKSLAAGAATDFGINRDVSTWTGCRNLLVVPAVHSYLNPTLSDRSGLQNFKKDLINKNLLVTLPNMVRTSGGIRISAGKSSKKGGGGGNSRPSPYSSSGKSSSKGSSHLPPIPHCEVPNWQKPITNFFNIDASSSKNDNDMKIPEDVNTAEENKENDSVNENEETNKKEKGRTPEEGEIKEFDNEDKDVSSNETLVMYFNLLPNRYSKLLYKDNKRINKFVDRSMILKWSMRYLLGVENFPNRHKICLCYSYLNAERHNIKEILTGSTDNRLLDKSKL